MTAMPSFPTPPRLRLTQSTALRARKYHDSTTHLLRYSITNEGQLSAAGKDFAVRVWRLEKLDFGGDVIYAVPDRAAMLLGKVLLLGTLALARDFIDRFDEIYGQTEGYRDIDRIKRRSDTYAYYRDVVRTHERWVKKIMAKGEDPEDYSQAMGHHRDRLARFAEEHANGHL